MKTRNWVVAVSLVLALVAFLGISSLGFVGCSSKAPAEIVPEKYKSITMVDGSMGGSIQAMMIPMSRTLNKYYPEITWGVRTGVVADSLGRLAEGTVLMTYAGPTTYVGLYGEGKEAQSRLRALAMQTVERNVMLVPKNAPYDTGRDLPKGLSLSGGVPGSSGPMGCALWLKAFGLSKTDFSYRELGKAETAEAWRNGTINLLWNTGGIPNPFLAELSTTKQLFKPLKVTEADLKPVAQETRSKGFFVMELPLVEDAPQYYTYNTWGFQGVYFLVVRDDFPVEIAYKIVKIFDEHLDELIAGSPLCKNVTPANLIQFTGGAIPIHSGAEKYFKEKGYLK